MRTTGVQWSTVLLLAAGCATVGTEERRLWREIYWDAARDCEQRFGTLKVEHVQLDGEVSLTAAAESRSELQGFRACYWSGIQDRIERLRTRGETLPDTLAREPDVDLE